MVKHETVIVIVMASLTQQLLWQLWTSKIGKKKQVD